MLRRESNGGQHDDGPMPQADVRPSLCWLDAVQLKLEGTVVGKPRHRHS